MLLIKVKTLLKSKLGILVALGSIFTFASNANGYSHAYINMTRSSVGSKIFVSQSVEGEYGKYKLTGKKVESEGNLVEANPNSNWRGSGIKTTFGLETMKFLQFSAGHTFINVRNQEDGLELLSGSKLNAELKFVFLAPIGNLELAVGGNTAKLDYRRSNEISDFAGTGVYYSMGINYFLSSKISTFGTVKMENNHYVRSGGSASVESIDSETTHIGAGFTIWI